MLDGLESAGGDYLPLVRAGEAEHTFGGGRRPAGEAEDRRVRGSPGQELMDTGFAMATAGIAAMMPALPAAFLTVPHLGMPHAHAHPPSLVPPAPPVPLPSIGTLMLAGSVGVLIMGMPAGRCGDLGLAMTCGSFSPAFDVFLGSSNTFIAGNRAARLGDMTRHCNPASAALAVSRGAALFNAAVGLVGVAADAAGGGPVMGAIAQIAADLAAAAMSALLGKDPGVPPAFGALMLGAPTVLIGGFPCPNLPNPLDALMHGLKCLGKAIAKSKGFGKLLNKVGYCNSPGEPIHPLTGEVYNEFEDYRDPANGFVWARHYRSGWSHERGPLGPGFRHSYQRSLRLARKRAVYETYDGELVALAKASDGSYEPIAGFSLKALDAATYELRTDRDELLVYRVQSGSPNVGRLDRYKTPSFDAYLFYDDAGKLRALSEFNGFAAVDTHLLYDADNRLIEVRRGVRGQTPVVLARYVYADGCLSEHHDASGGITRYGYDGSQRMAVSTSASGYSFHWHYDGAGRCIKSYGDDGLFAVEAKYEGTTSTFREPDGGTWTFKHYPNGGISHIVGPDGGVTQYVQDDAGRVIKQVIPGGQEYTWLYDETGKHTGRLDPFGFEVPPEDVAANPNTLAHDAPVSPKGFLVGRPLGELGLSLRTIPSAARAILPPPPTLAGAKRHDAMGRCVEQALPDGNLRTLVYDADGNNVAEHVGPPGTAFAPRPLDSRGGWRTREYGSWYLLTADATPLGNVTRFDYSHHGAWRTVTDPNGNRTEYVRDQRHRVTEIHRYGGVFRRYRYDASNTVVEEQDGGGQALITYDNDARGQHLTKKLLSGESYEYEYDRHGRCTRAASSLHDVRQVRVGLKLALDQRDGKGVEHEYDERKRLKESVIFGRFKIQLSYLSDARVRIQTPDGSTHVFRQHQHCVVRENGNGTTEALTFDEAERLTARACWRESDDTHTPFWHARYKYASTGELLENTDLQRPATYEYDADGRIAAEHGQNGERRYTYDPAGNLLSTPQVRALRYLDGNLLSSADFEHFRYDDRRRLAARNHTNGHVTEYLYDSQNQLTGARIDGELVWRASYDGLGRRLWREYRGERTDFYWDSDRLAAERSPDGRLRVYVYPNEDALVPFMWLDYANDDAPASAGRVSYLYTAPNGMPLRVEDSEGAEIWRASAVDAYGEIAADAECPTRLRFAGHFYDEHLGLFYNRFRDYDPKLGCYLQPDPLGHGGGPNLFAYTRNPLADVDLRGLTVHKIPDSPKPHGADGSGHPDGEASDHPKPRPKGKETDLVDEHGRPKKPLKDMSDDELKEFTKQRAQQINDAQHPQEAKRTTTAVTVVETPPGNKDSRKVVVTSSENREPKMPNKVGGEEIHPKGSPRDSALNSDEEFRKTPPVLSKQGTEVGEDGKPQPVDHTGKPGKQRDYFDENGEPYKKADTSNPDAGGETRHHAEQRGQTSTTQNADGTPREPKEWVAAMSPTKPCCPGCRSALEQGGNLDKVPTDLQGTP